MNFRALSVLLLCLAASSAYAAPELPPLRQPSKSNQETKPLSGYTLSGHVVDPAGSPWSGFEITVASSDKSQRLITKTVAEDGSYKVTGLPQGTVKVSFKDEGRSVGNINSPDGPATVSFDLIGNMTKDFTLHLGGRHLGGHVVGAVSSKPIAGATITVVHEKRPKAKRTTTTTKSDGSYEIMVYQSSGRDGYDPIKVEVSKSGFKIQEKPLSMSANKIDFGLEAGT